MRGHDLPPVEKATLARLKRLPDSVAAVAIDYEGRVLSKPEWIEVRPFVLNVISQYGFQTESQLKKYLPTLVQYAYWNFLQGMELAFDEVFQAEQVETWRAHLRAEVQDTRAKDTSDEYASRMRILGRKLNPASNWPVYTKKVDGGARRLVRKPYSDTELSAIESSLSTQEESKAKTIATTVMALCLGAGLKYQEIVLAKGSDIEIAADGLWINVPGKRGRRVPVVSKYAKTLTAVKKMKGNAKLLEIESGKNYLSQKLKEVKGGKNCPAIDISRLRTTWMVHRLRAGVDSRTLIYTYAGLKTMNVLPSLAQYLPPSDAEKDLAAARKSVG